MTRDRPGGERQRAAREGTAHAAIRRGDGEPGGRLAARDGKGPASGERRGASGTSGHKPRGSFAGGKPGGDKTGDGKTGGGGRSGRGKAGGGRPAGRPKR